MGDQGIILKNMLRFLCDTELKITEEDILYRFGWITRQKYPNAKGALQDYLNAYYGAGSSVPAPIMG